MGATIEYNLYGHMTASRFPHEPDEDAPRIKEWNELKLTLYEKIAWLPERHPFPIKCLLYLAFNVAPVPWPAIYKVAEAMGYVPITVEDDLGNGDTFVTKGWVGGP